MGRTHKQQGIEKRVSENVYPADILSDFELMSSPLDVFGAWMKCLLFMWRDKTDRVSNDWPSWGRIWGCADKDCRAIVDALKERKVCTVTHRNGKVTLISRRRQRMLKAKQKGAERAKRYREKQDRHAPVTRKKHRPSSSLSLSSITGGSLAEKIQRQKRLEAVEKLKAKTDPQSPRYRELRHKENELLEAIVADK